MGTQEGPRKWKLLWWCHHPSWGAGRVRWSWEARVSCLSCCVISDRPAPPWATCPSNLGKGLRGHCGFCRPEPPKVIIGVWPCLPRGPSGSSPVSAHHVPLGPQATRVKRRTEQIRGWGWGGIPASAQPLAPCDCSGPWFSLCTMGQQPSSAPSPRVPVSLWSPSLPRGWADKEGFAKTKSPSVWSFREGLRVLRKWRPGGRLSCWYPSRPGDSQSPGGHTGENRSTWPHAWAGEPGASPPQPLTLSFPPLVNLQA